MCHKTINKPLVQPKFRSLSPSTTSLPKHAKVNLLLILEGTEKQINQQLFKKHHSLNRFALIFRGHTGYVYFYHPISAKNTKFSLNSNGICKFLHTITVMLQKTHLIVQFLQSSACCCLCGEMHKSISF